MNVPIEYLCQQAVSVLGNVALANAFTGTSVTLLKTP
jgi:hypothetical protein